MTTPRLRYHAGEGFENETHKNTRLRWLLVLLTAVAALSAWYLYNGQKATGYLLVTADQSNLPVRINLEPNNTVTPALFELSGDDSLTVSLHLTDQLTIPSFYRLQPQPGETLQVHFELHPLQEMIQPEPVPTTEAADSTAIFDANSSLSERLTGLSVSQTRPGELLLPPSTTPATGIYLRTNLVDVTWHYGERIYRADGNQLIIQSEDKQPVTIIPELAGYQFSPGSLTVVPAELHDSYLYFHGQPLAQLSFELKSEPVEVDVLLNGKELGRTPLLLNLDVESVNLSFAVPAGFLIPPPLQFSEIDNGTVVTVHLNSVTDLEWSCGNDNSGKTGYVMPENDVVIDNEGKQSQSDGILFWELGPQFLSKRPHGSRALVCDFTLPDYDLEQQLFNLQLTGRDSGKNYPFTFRNYCTVTVQVNGSMLLEEVEVTGDLLTADGPGWDISRYLNYGSNRIVVQVGEESLRYFLLKGVHLEAAATGH
jgi:hypothetical protein